MYGATAHQPPGLFAMSLFRHVLFAFVYGALAVVVALTLRYSIEGIDRWVAVGIGALVLVFGAVIHEVYSRQERERQFREAILDLTRERSTLEAELARTRSELGTLRDRMQTTESGSEAGQAIAAISTEVRLLRQLVDRLSDGDAKLASSAPIHEPLRARPPDPPAPRSTAAPTGPTEAGPGEPDMKEPEQPAPDLGILVRDAVRHDRIDIALQPIVRLPQRTVAFYEALSRVRLPDGTVLLPADYVPVAERAGAITAIDNLLLFRCIQLTRRAIRRHDAVGFFSNLSHHTLHDRHFLAELAEFLEDNRELPPHLIFDIRFEALAGAADSLSPTLERINRLGVRFSVEDIPRLDVRDIEMMARHRIRFAKIDAATLIDLARNGLSLEPIKHALARGAIDLIASKVETRDMLVELLDLPVAFGQGLLFGEPKVG